MKAERAFLIGYKLIHFIQDTVHSYHSYVPIEPAVMPTPCRKFVWSTMRLTSGEMMITIGFAVNPSLNFESSA